VAWGLLALGCVGNAAGVALAVVNGSFRRNPGEALLWVVFAAFLVVGCLILARRPGSIIGWILTAVGLLTMTAGLAETYAHYAYVSRPASLPAPSSRPGSRRGAGARTILLTLVFPLLLFPTGRPRSPRWRPVVWLAVGMTAAYAVLAPLSNPLLPRLGNGPYLLVIALPVGVGIAILRYRLYDIDRRCSGRPGAASRWWWIGASTGPSRTRPGLSRCSAPGSGTRSTSTPCRRSWWRWWSRRCSRPVSGCGSARRRQAASGGPPDRAGRGDAGRRGRVAAGSPGATSRRRRAPPPVVVERDRAVTRTGGR
jgi:hypothetical protein